MSVFKAATHGEVLRAAQKDLTYSEILQENISSLCLDILGPRLWIKYKWLCQPTVRAIYYFLTTCSGFQTLGEEYTGIIQVAHGRRRIPSTIPRLLMVFLHSFGPHFLKGLLKKAKAHLINKQKNEDTVARIEMLFYAVDKCVEFIDKFNVCLFYFHGQFYHLSKRLAGVSYVKYVGLQNGEFDNTRSSFKFLGWLTSIHLILSLIYDMYKSRLKIEKVVTESENSDIVNSSELGTGKRCLLCLEALGTRGGVSAATCGHVFCWTCIHESIRVTPECPVCRRVLAPHNIIPCRNY